MQFQDQPGAGSPSQPFQVQPNAGGSTYPPQNGTAAQPYNYQQAQGGVYPQAPTPGVFVAPAHATVPTQPPASGFQDKPKIPDRKSVATKLIELTYLLLIILESALALRFTFKLLGANTKNILISLLYGITNGFTFPFEGLFRVTQQNEIQVSGYNLEFTTLVAMGVYALIVYIVVRIIDMFR